MKRKNSRRGVTIFEAVIAMAVIMAVSVTAITIISNFSRISGTMLARNEALTSAENALECFKFADSLKQFDELLDTVGTRVFTTESYTEPHYEDAEEGAPRFTRGVATYSMEDAYYTVRIQVIYTLDTALCSISVVDYHGVSAYSVVNYTKAVNFVG